MMSVLPVLRSVYRYDGVSLARAGSDRTNATREQPCSLILARSHSAIFLGSTTGSTAAETLKWARDTV